MAAEKRHSDQQAAAIPLPTTRSDPLGLPPELDRLRREEPLSRLAYPDGHVGWLVTSHMLARELLSDSRFSVHPPRPAVGDPEKSARYFEATAQFPNTEGALIELDPPAHTRIRRLQTGHFTVRRVAEQRPAIERVADACLDAMEHAAAPTDLVETFAFPFASTVLCELLGVSAAERTEFERPSATIQDPDASAEDMINALGGFSDYCTRIIEQKRAAPGTDILSELIATGDLTDKELIGVALQLFSAGHETTASMLSLSVFTLLSEPTRWEELRRDFSVMPDAVEELLRYLTIVQLGTFARTALEDVELDGNAIKAGESVTVSLSAANRDPEVFTDPNTLELSRDSRRHLAFGYGRHMCLGQHFARLELQVSLERLIRRFPTLHLAVPVSAVRLESTEKFLYGVRELSVGW